MPPPDLGGGVFFFFVKSFSAASLHTEAPDKFSISALPSQLFMGHAVQSLDLTDAGINPILDT